MEKQKSNNYFLKMILPLIILVAVQNLASIVVMEIAFVYDMGHYNDGTYTDFITSWIKQVSSGVGLDATYLIYSVSCIVIFYLLYKKLRTDEKPLMGQNPFVGLTDNILAFVIGMVVLALGLQYVSNYVLNALSSAFPTWLEDYESLLESAGLTDSVSVFMMIYAVILAPICEELAFRGLAFKNATHIMPASWAVVIQAVLFGIFHGNMLQGCYTFLVGLALGYVMYRYDNIIAPIFLHMLYNAISMFFGNYLPMGGSNIIEFFFWLLGSLIVTCLGLWLVQMAAPGIKISKDSSDN